LVVAIETGKVNWILDADIRSFFDTVSHDWLLRFLERRIGERRVLRLIRKWLKVGVLENGGGEQPLRRQVREGRADAGGDGLRCLRLRVAHADDAEDHGLVAEAVDGGEIEIGLGGFDRDLLDPGGRLVLLNNCGHWLPFEKPAEWTAQVLALLKGY
jgi:pimeloyl-ACP methyl ester carboxylesterase